MWSLLVSDWSDKRKIWSNEVFSAMVHSLWNRLVGKKFRWKALFLMSNPTAEKIFQHWKILVNLGISFDTHQCDWKTFWATSTIFSQSTGRPAGHHSYQNPVRARFISHTILVTQDFCCARFSKLFKNYVVLRGTRSQKRKNITCEIKCGKHWSL